MIARPLFLCASLLAAPCAASEGAIQGDPAYGEYLYGECTVCHGSGRAGIPAIEGYSAASTIALLKAYRNGDRDHAAMRTVAQSLGDAEIAALAVYIASLRPRE